MTGDPGLRLDRTRLAWRRTALVFAGVASLSGRTALAGGRADALIALPLLLVAAAAVVLCWRRGTERGLVSTGGRSVPLAALAVVGYAVLGSLLVLRRLW